MVIKLDIPGKGELILNYLVLDYNGTLARDGYLLPGLAEKLNELSEHLKIYVLTADTFGRCREQCKEINLDVHILEKPLGAKEKERFIQSLGSTNVVAVGNGNNDRFMLAGAALGIAVLAEEGLAGSAFKQADILVKNIGDAFDLLLKPRRLVATLRG